MWMTVEFLLKLRKCWQLKRLWSYQEGGVPRLKLLELNRAVALQYISPTEWQKSQLTLELSRAHFPQWEGRSAGRGKWVFVSEETTAFYEFLGHSHLSAVVRESSPQRPPPLLPEERSLRDVLYVKSMVLG